MHCIPPNREKNLQSFHQMFPEYGACPYSEKYPLPEEMMGNPLMLWVNWTLSQGLSGWPHQAPKDLLWPPQLSHLFHWVCSNQRAQVSSNKFKARFKCVCMCLCMYDYKCHERHAEPEVTNSFFSLYDNAWLTLMLPSYRSGLVYSFLTTLYFTRDLISNITVSFLLVNYDINFN